MRYKCKLNQQLPIVGRAQLTQTVGDNCVRLTLAPKIVEMTMRHLPKSIKLYDV